MPAAFLRSNVLPGSRVGLATRFSEGRPKTLVVEKLPKARAFNYLQSDQLEFTNDPTATGQTAITAALWARFDTNDEGNNDSGVISKDIPTANGSEAYGILRDAGNAGKYRFVVNNGTSTQTTATMSSALTTLTWYFMVGRWTSGSQIEFLVYNEAGSLVASTTSASTVSGSIPLDNIKPVWFGRSFFGFWDGSIQRARLYGSRLSDAQILAALTDTGEDQSALLDVQLTHLGQTEEDVSGHFSVGAFTGSRLVAGPIVTVANSYTLVADSASFSLSAQDAGLNHQFYLAADTASYSLSASNTGLVASRLLTADLASYALTANAAGLFAQRLLTANSAAFALGAQDAGLVASRYLAASVAAFSLGAQAAGLFGQFLLTAGSASYSLVGNDAALTLLKTLIADSAAYTLTANDVAFVRSLVMAAGNASYALSAQDAGLRAQRLLTADTAAFALSAQDAALTKVVLLAAVGAAYTLSAQNVAFVLARVFLADRADFALTGNAANLLAQRLLTADGAAFALTGQDVLFDWSGSHHQMAAERADYALTAQDVTFQALHRLVAENVAFSFSAADIAFLRSLPYEIVARALTRVIANPAAASRVLQLITEASTRVLTQPSATSSVLGS